MNKQELIERIEGLKNIFWDKCEYVKIDFMIELVSKLDEPQKVQVPQFVAEHIKHAKEIGRDLQDAMNSTTIHEEVDQWLYTDDNIDLFARAWLDGYEVEKEPKYTVKVKAILGQYLGRYYLNNEELTPRFTRTQLAMENELPTFTRKELEEAGFGWVFDCEGIEIEEVME